MRPGPIVVAVASLALAACPQAGPPPTGGGQQYSLTDTRPGTFSTSNAGRPIAAEQMRAMGEDEVLRTFGRPALDRTEEPARVMRFHSDGCTLFVSLYREGGGWRVRHADAYDPQLRRLASADACAGSVAAQRRSA